MGNRNESRQPLREPSFRRNNNQTEATKTTPKSIKSIPILSSRRFFLSIVDIFFSSNFSFTCISHYEIPQNGCFGTQQYTISCNFHSRSVLQFLILACFSFIHYSLSLLFSFVLLLSKPNIPRKNTTKQTKKNEKRVIFWLFSSQTVNMLGCISVNH